MIETKRERLPGGITNPVWLQEHNYRLLRRLVPELEHREGRLVAVRDGEEHLVLAVHEQHRYTTVVTVTKRFPSHNGVVPELRMEVRAYHDARVAEVTAYQDCHNVPARYHIDGNGRFLRDERRQVNILLHDLLTHCLRHDPQELEPSECAG